MIIALFADIHANREAFTACLADARARGVTHYVFLGDYVGYGADPGCVVDEVMAQVARGAIAVAGNHDMAITTPRQRMNDTAKAAIDWTRDQLNDAQKDFLNELPMIARRCQAALSSMPMPARPTSFHYVHDEMSALRAACARRNVRRPSAATCTFRRSIICVHGDKVGHFTPVADVEIPLLAAPAMARRDRLGRPAARSQSGRLLRAARRRARYADLHARALRQRDRRAKGARRRPAA